MFLPDSCDCLLNLPSSSNCINYVVANRERSIFAVVTDNSLLFYLSNTRLLTCEYQRDENEFRERGVFTKAFWKPDSSAICVTANNCLNIFAVEIVSNPAAFNLHDPASGNAPFSRESSEFYLSQNRPQINVNLSVVAHLEAEPTCVLSFKEELIVCLMDGWLHRLSWAGTVLQELSFNIRSIGHEQPGSTGSKADHRHPPNHHYSSYHVVDISPFLGGICVVLNDGRAALLVSSSTNFQPGTINAIWAGGLTKACCCATNFRYRLIYFGSKNGEIVTYSLDDLNGTLVQLFVVHLTLKNCTEHLERLTSVRQIRCLSPNGNAFAVIWNTDLMMSKKLHEKGKNSDNSIQNDGDLSDDEDTARLMNGIQHNTPPALAIFSPFGAQWWCSLEDASDSPPTPLNYTTMDWALKGFQLWMGTNDGFQLINLIHSTENLHSHVMMTGADRVYLSPSTSADQTVAISAPHLIWQIFKPPHNYLSTNGPITFIATDSECDKILVVAGTYGFCFYNFRTTKWRMFRKEAQEQSLLLTGGIVVFDQFILCSACNLDLADDDKERIYSFHIDKQLDLDSAQSIPTNRILQISLSRMHLLTFDVNSQIAIYSLSISQKDQLAEKQQNNATVSMECVAEIRIAEFLSHPSCFVSMELTKLNFHSDTIAFCDNLDSLLVNISGHLLLLSPMQPHSVKSQEEDAITEFQLHPPTLIASFVEEFWTTGRFRQKNDNNNVREGISFFEEALWINAGCKNSRVWLPLSSDPSLDKSLSPSSSIARQRKLAQQNSRTFISRRIMLPIELDIYPLCVNSDYLACGANCISLQLKTSTAPKLQSDNLSLATEDSSSLSSYVGMAKNDNLSRLSVHSLVRVSEVFIHKLLKQLLKRNLGSYAFELASACRSLSYFGHILELLLHDLLDEEATSSEPIPDPLLPTAVAFLREFPSEYLQTIVYCARKTELAFWSLLFSVSHHPRQLFQMCLNEGKLDTATSCLMILHSMENLQESSKLAFRLLDEALGKRRWTVAQDIVRFMHNISQAVNAEQTGGEDGDGNEPESPLQQKLSSLSHHYQPKQPFSGFNSPSADEFSFPLFSSQVEAGAESRTISQSQRRRSTSIGKTTVAVNDNPISPPSRQQTISGGSDTVRQMAKSSYSRPGKDAKSSKLPKLNTTKAVTAPATVKEEENGWWEKAKDEFAGGASYAKIDEVLTKYASNLLEDYALRDLGAFSSYLEFDLVQYFRTNTFSVGVEEFPLVLMKLHAQFNWPYPFSFPANLPANPSYSSLQNGSSHGGSSATLSNISGTTRERSNFIIEKTAKTGERRESELETESSGDEEEMAGSNTVDGASVAEGEDGSGKQLIVCDWKVLGKFCHRSKVKGSAQSEAELEFIYSVLQKAEAYEWLYLLCILRQDILLVRDRILAKMDGKRTELFLGRVLEGTRELYSWTQSKCPAYSTVMRIFKEFVESQ